jgi:glycosyltransferase involved in cell wall biosynthesis
MNVQLPTHADVARPVALHILMLLGGAYPPPHGGGMELQVRTLAKGLRQRGHRVTVMAPCVARGPQRRIDRLDGVPVCRLPYPRLPLVGGVWLMFRQALFLWSKGRRYDAWHVHSPRRLAAVAALLGSGMERPRVVIKVSSAEQVETGNLAMRPTLLARVTFHCLRKADAWQAISRRIANALADRGIPAARIAAIPNAVDIRRFHPERHVASARPRFLFIGRLVPEKNLFALLDAFAALVRSHPEAQLRIVGDGRLETALKNHACGLGIQGSVDFAGHRDDIEALIADADVGVLPSTVEGLSNTLLECMAGGLPMIASRVSGSEDLVTPANGWLFEPADVAGLVACLTEAATLPSTQRREMGARARATIERHATLPGVLDRMLALYRGQAAPTIATASIDDRTPMHAVGMPAGEHRP